MSDLLRIGGVDIGGDDGPNHQDQQPRHDGKFLHGGGWAEQLVGRTEGRPLGLMTMIAPTRRFSIDSIATNTRLQTPKRARTNLSLVLLLLLLLRPFFLRCHRQSITGDTHTSTPARTHALPAAQRGIVSSPSYFQCLTC